MNREDFRQMMKVINNYLKSEEELESFYEINFDPDKKTIPVTTIATPSSCKVQLAFKVYFGAKFQSNEKMLLGTKLHEGLIEIIKNHWEEITENTSKLENINPEFEKPLEYSLENGWTLVGRADMVLGDEIYEFKFKDTKGYDKFDSSDSDFGTQVAVEQLNAYLHIYDDAKIGFIWTFNIDDFGNPGKHKQMKPKVVYKNEKMFEETIQKANIVISIIEKLKNGKLPENDILQERLRLKKAKKLWMCKSCHFLAICKYVEKKNML